MDCNVAAVQAPKVVGHYGRCSSDAGRQDFVARRDSGMQVVVVEQGQVFEDQDVNAVMVGLNIPGSSQMGWRQAASTAVTRDDAWVLMRMSDEVMEPSVVAMVHAWCRLLADSDDPGDVRARVFAPLEGLIRVWQSRLVLRLLCRPAFHWKSSIVRSVASEACHPFRPALSYELFVQPTRWSSTDCASRS